MLIELNKVVYGICDEQNDTSHKYFARYLRFANLAWKDLCLYVVPHTEELNVKSLITQLGNNWVVQLPEDVAYLSKVGICANGRIVVIGTSEDICTIDSNNSNCPCEETTTEINNICCGTYGGELSQYTFYNSFRQSQSLGELYGLAGGSYCAYVKYDKKNNRLIFSSDLSAQEVIVEYKSDGVGHGATLVPTECDLAIREFVDHRTNIHAKPQIADRAWERYITEYNRLKKFYSSYTIEEWRNIFLKATTSSIKR